MSFDAASAFPADFAMVAVGAGATIRGVDLCTDNDGSAAWVRSGAATNTIVASRAAAAPKVAIETHLGCGR